MVRREPIGVVAAVIPWNSPFSAALTKIIPALLAGNTVILKVPSENSPGRPQFARDLGIPLTSFEEWAQEHMRAKAGHDSGSPSAR